MAYFLKKYSSQKLISKKSYNIKHKFAFPNVSLTFNIVFDFTSWLLLLLLLPLASKMFYFLMPCLTLCKHLHVSYCCLFFTHSLSTSFIFLSLCVADVNLVQAETCSINWCCRKIEIKKDLNEGRFLHFKWDDNDGLQRSNLRFDAALKKFANCLMPFNVQWVIFSPKTKWCLHCRCLSWIYLLIKILQTQPKIT